MNDLSVGMVNCGSGFASTMLLIVETGGLVFGGGGVDAGRFNSVLVSVDVVVVGPSKVESSPNMSAMVRGEKVFDVEEKGGVDQWGK